MLALGVPCTVFEAGSLKASNKGASDFFGYSVGLSGDGSTLVVGAHGEDSSATGVDGTQADDSATNSGAVYVFVRSGVTWTQQAYLKASNTGAEDSFGYAVALSGDGSTLAVGALSEASRATGVNGDQDNNVAVYSGAVYVFVRDGASWSQQAYLKASNTEALDDFGNSVTLSSDGSTLAVGAPGEDSSATGVNGDQANNAAPEGGAVYVFVRSGGSWSQQAYLKASNTGEADEFGSSVALSADGNTLAVGAPGEASNARGVNGNQTNNSAPEGGAVYMFLRSDAWGQQAYLKASNAEEGDRFGYSVALSGDGNTLAVGAYYEDSNASGVGGNQADNSAARSGAVYVFVGGEGTWSQQAYLKASNTGAGDGFGGSVVLSGEGNALAIGATGEASSASGVNGDQGDNAARNSGAVYVFFRVGVTWTQNVYLKAPHTDAEDYFGNSVALGVDGTVLAVGAYRQDGPTETNGDPPESGAVYVRRIAP